MNPKYAKAVRGNSPETGADLIRSMIPDLNNLMFCISGNAELLMQMDISDSAKNRVKAILDAEHKISSSLRQLSNVTKAEYVNEPYRFHVDRAV